MKTTPLWFIAVLLLAACPAVAEDTVTDAFQAAAEAYSRGEYDRAAALYEIEIKEKGYSAQLLHNLGNSYARSGRIGYAVLSYERALRLLPSAGDTRGNLELVRKEAGLFKEQQFFRDYFEPLLQLDQWLLFLLCLIILTTTLEAVTLLRPLPGKNHRLLLCCLLFLITAAAAGTIFKWYDLHSGVVVTSNSRLMLSPFDSAPSSGIIEEGRMVQIMSTHGDFVRVRTRSGREGWLSIAPHEPDVAPLRKY